MGTVTVITTIQAPAEVCFDAARDVALHVESASFSHERLVAPGRLEGLLEAGDLVCFEGRHFGLRQRFCARITELDRPHRFVDEMVNGAFRWLRHVHQFTQEDASTQMVDVLTWEAPLGPLGRIADRLFIERHLGAFVKAKQRALKHMIETRKFTVSTEFPA